MPRHPPPLPSLSLPSRHELHLLRLCPRNMTYPALSAIATWACLPRLCPLDIASPLVQSARASAGSVPRQRSLRERLDAAPSRRAPPRRMSNPRGCSAGVRRLLRRCHTRPSRTAAACAAPTGRALPARPTPRPPARPPIRAGRRARRRRSGRGWRCRGAGCHAAGCHVDDEPSARTSHHPNAEDAATPIATPVLVAVAATRDARGDKPFSPGRVRHRC
jgi:hypothetical protein